ncbi:MAG: amidase [Chloroflexota bacterium]|nr:amidase [Chloroflexota bacterium]
MGDDLCFATIEELGDRLARWELSPVELTEAVLTRIEQHNDEMRAYITVTREVALEQARQAEREMRAGKRRGPMHGIPIALKDNVATASIRTSCASMVDPEWVPDEDATVYTKLREAGAILLGKANLYEYAFSMNPAFPQPLNPWHAERSSAGSSSGSAVSVAAGMAHGSIGSDTGGSGRQPANVNGVVGFKGTYGLVSRAGVVPLSYSLDHVTVFNRQAVDAAIMLEAIAGHDPRDEYSASLPVADMRSRIGTSLRGMRIGRARGYTYENIDADVERVTNEAFEVLRGLGADIQDVELPYVQHCVALQQSIMLPEAATVHYRNLRESPDKLGEVAIMRLDLGNSVPATAYIHAQQVRKLMRAAFRRLFKTCDVIVGPGNAVRAGAAGEWTTELDGRTIDLRQVGPEYTGIYNLSGNPAIVIPAGFSSEGTPIGIQIAGRWWDEPTVLQVAHAFEQATDWHGRRPPLPVG